MTVLAPAQLLYLDYDGVLHPDAAARFRKGPSPRLLAPGHALFESAPRLVSLLAPYPRLAIVLSTSWSRVLGYERARSYLPAELQARVIGATYHRRHHEEADFLALSRVQQVLADVHRRRPRQWLAIDDQVADRPESLREHFLVTPPTEGLQCAQTTSALTARLATLFHPPAA